MQNKSVRSCPNHNAPHLSVEASFSASVCGTIYNRTEVRGCALINVSHVSSAVIIGRAASTPSNSQYDKEQSQVACDTTAETVGFIEKGRDTVPKPMRSHSFQVTAIWSMSLRFFVAVQVVGIPLRPLSPPELATRDGFEQMHTPDLWDLSRLP
jgi:hypothetical protein